MRMNTWLSAATLALAWLSAAPSGAQERPPGALAPPVVIDAPAAEYPEAALRDGASGDVLLELDLDDRGTVTASSIVAGVRPDLDEAARGASLRFRFRPATRGGAPVPSRIRYRYQFLLPSAAAPSPPPVTSPAASAGPSAAASAAASAGPSAAPGMPPGEPAAGGEPPAAEEIEVRGERIPLETTRRPLSREEFTHTPGTNGDPLRAIQSLPGVARSAFPSSGLIVRGTSATSTPVYIDGSWLPLAYHFGGLSSVIPAELIERIDFMPGDHGARWGRGVGGVVDVHTRELSRDGRYRVVGQVDLIDARALVEGPLPFAPGWSFVAGARRSWLDAWLGPVLRSTGADVKTAPYYYDYQLFAETHFAERTRLRLGVYGGADEMRFVQDKLVEDDPVVGGTNDLGLGYHRIQANLDSQLSDQTRASAMLSLGRNVERIGFGRVRARDTIDMLFTRGELAHRLSPALTLRSGWDAQWATGNFALRVPYEGVADGKPGGAGVGTFSSGRWVSIDTSATFSRPGGWLEAEIKPIERLTAVAGLRGDYARESRTFDASPRLAASFVAHEASPRTTLRAAGGVYHQPADPIDLIPGLGSSLPRTQRARQVSAGVDQQITRRATASVELYRKDLDRLVSRTPTADGYAVGNLGEGRVVGLEVMLRHVDDGRFFGWLSYSLSRATRTAAPGAPSNLFEQDQTHTFTALGSYKLGWGLQLGARFRYVTGSPYTACTAGLLDAGSGTYACVPGATLAARLPDFHQLDIRLDKTWEVSSWKLNAYLDVQNVYNRGNADGLTYNFDKSRHEIQPGLPILPILGLRGEL
jgi:TonB family protein